VQAISRRFRDFTRVEVFLEVLRQAPSAHSEAQQFALFKATPGHPSLGFARKGGINTVEIGRSYRALARERAGHYYWFWIGTHEDYNKFQF
jgi:hypothetical protein